MQPSRALIFIHIFIYTMRIITGVVFALILIVCVFADDDACVNDVTNLKPEVERIQYVQAPHNAKVTFTGTETCTYDVKCTFGSIQPIVATKISQTGTAFEFECEVPKVNGTYDILIQVISGTKDKSFTSGWKTTVLNATAIKLKNSMELINLNDVIEITGINRYPELVAAQFLFGNDKVNGIWSSDNTTVTVTVPSSIPCSLSDPTISFILNMLPETFNISLSASRLCIVPKFLTPGSTVMVMAGVPTAVQCNVNDSDVVDAHKISNTAIYCEMPVKMTLVGHDAILKLNMSNIWLEVGYVPVINECPVGTQGYQNECTNCSIGYYRSLGDISCVSCGDASTTTLTGATSKSMCKCKDGAVSVASGCACAAGKQYESNVCKECPVGMYKSDVSNTACLPCGPGYTTHSTGADSINQCIRAARKDLDCGAVNSEASGITTILLFVAVGPACVIFYRCNRRTAPRGGYAV